MTTALIGTTKGLFVLTGERGGTFAERGPLFPGENVDATLIDARRDARHPTWFVGSKSSHWGPTLRRSDDAGATWTERTRPRSHSRRGQGPVLPASGSLPPARRPIPTWSTPACSPRPCSAA